MKTKLIGVACVTGAMLLLSAIGSSAQEPVFYNPVSAYAAATYAQGSSGCGGTVSDVALDYWGKQPDAHSLVAAARAVSASAGSAMSHPDVEVAMANVSGGGSSAGGPCVSDSASGILTGRATIYDPQGRPSIKLRTKFKAAGSSAPPGPGLSSLSGWGLLIGSALDNAPSYTLNPDGTFASVFYPVISYHSILTIFGYTGQSGANPDAGSEICDDIGCESFPGYSTELATTIVFDAAPGTLWVQTQAGAQDEGFAMIDPVIEPDPTNPDVVVTMEGPTGTGNFSLSVGVTADQLIARGIDPGPFLRLGFLDESAPPPPPPPQPPPPPSVTDTTPPTTLATATPLANSLGWNKTPVTVTLSSNDNLGGSGVKEVHYTLVGATTGSQVVPGGIATAKISAEGSTTVTYFAVDNAGNQEAPKTLALRIDQTPPSITGLPSNCSLWPPDHQLVQVASVSVSDAMSGPAGTPVVTARSNEPEDGTGDGDVAPDEVISGGTVQVRAERAGNGTGRIYTITANASDLAGNAITQIATCSVPHDRVSTAPQ